MAVHTAAHHSAGQVLPFRESLMAMLGICFVTMLVALDQTVVGTALPTIVAELRGFNLYAWVATSYLLTSVITVPIFGRLGDYYGRKPFVIASIVVFTVASALCGLANNMLFLVLARGLQGIGGGMLVGTAFACIADLFPDSVVRLRWQVMMSSAFGIANAVGPSLGGILTQYYGWRSVFYVNLPVGLLSVFFVWRFLPHLRHVKHEGKMRLDWQGAGLIAIALGSLQLFVEMLPKHGLSAGSLMLLAASMVFITIGSIVNGRIVTRVKNPNAMLFVGFALLAVACLGVVIATRSMPRPLLVMFMVLGGLGLGFVMPNLTVFAQLTAGREHLGIATALLQSLRMIGGMIGTALTGTLVSHLYASGVQLSLDKDSASHWFSDLSDPQILINHEAQTTLLSQLAAAGHNGAMLLESARESLVAAIHIGLAVAAVVAVLAVWQSRRCV
jgi:MFS family permease